MKKLKTAKVFRYDEKENLWRSWEVEGIFVTGTAESFNLSDTLDRSANLVLRVMGDTTCDVKAADKITFEPWEGTTPPDGAHVVVSVTRNEHGINTSHTKILCR